MNEKLKSLVELAKKQKEISLDQSKVNREIPKVRGALLGDIVTNTVKEISKVEGEGLSTNQEESSSNLPSLMNLSLDLDQEITKDVVMDNVKITLKEMKGTPEQFNKARKKVGRLTTGTSAAAPLVCRGDDCPFRFKCVPGDTLVYTPDGMRKISSLKKGESVYSASWDGTVEEDLILEKKKMGTKPVFEIVTEYGLKLKLTADHKVLTDSKEGRKVYKSLDTGLCVGSSVYIVDPDMNLYIDSTSYGDLYEDKIVSIKLRKEVTVYDISVSKNSNFFANNILIHNCSYFLEGIHQEGENCLEEEQLIEYWTQKYFEDLAIDTKSISEMHALSRLVEITVMDLRMTKYLAINNPDLMMDFVTSADLNGAPLTQKGVSVAFDVKERLEKQKMKLLESLNATRERKLKAAVDTASLDRADKSSQLMEKLDKIANNLRNGREGKVYNHE